MILNHGNAEYSSQHGAGTQYQRQKTLTSSSLVFVATVNWIAESNRIYSSLFYYFPLYHNISFPLFVRVSV